MSSTRHLTKAIEHLRLIKEHDDKLDDAANAGANAVSPTGDDYNAIFALAMLALAHLEQVWAAP